MICCENNFCLYWQDDTCLLENISLSLQGVCQSCVCVDIGGSHVCSAVVDLATGQLCGEPHTDKVDAAAGARTIAGAWAANIRRTAAASGIGCIRCAGFAFPGPFDYERGISLIRGVRKFERIYGLDVAATLYPLLRECGTEEFRYVNDAAAFALGECLGGVADDAERVVALTLGTGVGSGFVAGRRLVTSGDEVPANGWVYCLPFEGGIVDEAFSTRWVCGRYRELTGQEIRVTIPGHFQRGGAPCAADRVLSSRFGAAAAELIREGKFGCMVALRDDKIVAVPLSEVAGKLKTVPPDCEIVAQARALGLSLGD